MSIAIVIAMYAIWSNTFAIGKLVLPFSPPVFLTGFRMVIAGVLLLGYLLLRNRSAFNLTKNQWLSLGLLGFFSIYLTNILEFWGLQHLSAAKTSFIYSLSPFFSAFFSYLHFKERMNGKKWIGFAISFLGCLPVLLTQTGSEELFQIFSFLSWPTLAVIGAAAASVYGWTLLRLLVKNSEVSPWVANGVSMFFGGILALINSFFIDSWSPIPIAKGHTFDVIQNILILTAVSNILCYNLFGMMLRRYTSTFLSFMGLLTPIFASFSGWFFLGEAPSWTVFLSTGIVSIGLWIVYRTEVKQGYIQESSKAPAES